METDFVKHPLPFSGLNGVLMANSLHYVKDSFGFIQKIEKQLTAQGCFLIVEYDTDRANTWVPYPQSYQSLHRLFTNAGYSSIIKWKERKSIYNNAMIYSAIIRR